MREEVLLMTAEERDRLHVIRQIVEGHLCQAEGAVQLGLGVRQIGRLVRAWKLRGDCGLVSQQRGKPSHNRLNEALRERIGVLLREKYADFGATLASEKLLELEDIDVSVETVRKLQIALGLWKPKGRRVRRVFQLRERRARREELVQIDGSPHDWFEGRAPRCTVIVFIDDASSDLLGLYFAPSETALAYLKTLRRLILEHGCPVALYSDRHGIFRVNAKDAQSGDGKTEFSRAAERLGITMIHAHTPQAKGRVERANQTLQDRLVKEMRLRNISSIEAANAFAPTFIAIWNQRFTVPARDNRPAFRPWTKSAQDLEQALARREERTLSKALTFSSGGAKYCVKTQGPGTALRRAKVMLYHFLDGGMEVHYKDRILPVTAYGKTSVPDPTEDEKTINARLDALIAAHEAA